jgi:hypothetical protein
MEATQFGYSTKNIPIPSENDFKKALIEKNEHEMESTVFS